MSIADGQRFLVTLTKPDISDCKTIYYEVTDIDFDDLEVEISDLIGAGSQVFDMGEEKEFEGGDITVKLLDVNGTTNAYFNFTTTSTSGILGSNTAISEKGLVINLPESVTIAEDVDMAYLNFTEADEKDNINAGVQFNATIVLSSTTSGKLHVGGDDVDKQEVSSDHDKGYVASELATMVELDSSGTENDYVITYFGEEVTTDVFVASADAEIVSEGIAQVMVVKDTEVSSVATKNLIVVGGSCINSAAATLVGGPYCGAAWTTATGIGSGQFLIKAYASSSLTSEMALLVAGYEVADTTNAATYLTTKANFDTSVGGIGTTSTAVLTAFE